MADILFVHNNFPAQFGFIAEALAAQGHRCVAIASRTGRAVPGVRLVTWQTSRGSTPNILREATRIEADLIRARAAAEQAVALRAEGFDPAVIIGHPGWGETTYLREIFPKARQIAYAEYYYRLKGGDVGFDPEFPDTPRDLPETLHAKNAGMALAFSEADAIVAPTPFQFSLLPPVFHARTHIIHEGIDTEAIRPRPETQVRLGDELVLSRDRPVVTFINRRFEPLRGCHIFMRALPQLMSAVPNAQVVMIGADEPGGYGRSAGQGQNWGQLIFGEIADRIDRSRLHFTGRVAHETMLAALAVSSAHVYYTYPFVLSWSALEAMASGCIVIGSDTPPVLDAIKDGESGILLDFFDVDALSDALIAACRDQGRFDHLREGARQVVLDRFDRKAVCLPQWLKLIETLL
jgi:glycosyltransferase involved in cell wall biosynthesis